MSAPMNHSTTARALHKIARARSALVITQPFWGCLALQLEVVERPDVETMATDGAKLYFAPDFVLSLAEPELIGVVAIPGAESVTPRRGILLAIIPLTPASSRADSGSPRIA